MEEIGGKMKIEEVNGKWKIEDFGEEDSVSETGGKLKIGMDEIMAVAPEQTAECIPGSIPGTVSYAIPGTVPQKRNLWEKFLSALYPLTMLAVASLAFGSHMASLDAMKKLHSGTEMALSPEVQKAFEQKIEAEFQEYSAENQRLKAEFENALNEILARNFTNAEKAIPGVTARFSSFGACNKLCFKMVKDRIKGTQELQAALLDALQAVNGPCGQGIAEVNDLLESFQQKLLENSNDFRSSVAEVLEEPQFQQIALKLEGTMGQVSESAVKLVSANVMAEIGAALELVCIRSTIRVVSRILGNAAGKLIAAGGGGAACAVADGPLPIGDIAGAAIAAGGAIWTAWDIYQAKKVIPREMRRTLEESVRKCRSDLNARALEKAKEFLDSAAGTNAELKNKILANGDEK